MLVPLTLTLANGLNVIAIERPQSPSFAAALTYGLGSYNDPADLPGVAHFSEHLAFLGANREVVERLTEGGGYANAKTGGEYTQFFASGPANKLSLALDFFSNILVNQPLTDAEVANERNIFRHELATSRSNARQSHLDRHWRITLGDPNWRIGRRQQIACIPRLTSERVNSWRLTHYRLPAAPEDGRGTSSAAREGLEAAAADAAARKQGGRC